MMWMAPRTNSPEAKIGQLHAARVVLLETRGMLTASNRFGELAVADSSKVTKLLDVV